MNPKPREQYEARARVAKAMAHPTRLLILDALSEREMCVCEITGLVGAEQPTVSKHLAILKQAGIVSDRREGIMIHYSLKIKCLKGLWECIEAVLRQNLADQLTAVGKP